MNLRFSFIIFEYNIPQYYSRFRTLSLICPNTTQFWHSTLLTLPHCSFLAFHTTHTTHDSRFRTKSCFRIFHASALPHTTNASALPRLIYSHTTHASALFTFGTAHITTHASALASLCSTTRFRAPTPSPQHKIFMGPAS